MTRNNAEGRVLTVFAFENQPWQVAIHPGSETPHNLDRLILDTYKLWSPGNH
jgi:hypothetical protein